MKKLLLFAVYTLLSLGGYAQPVLPVGITAQGDKYFLHVSKEALGRDMLLTTRVLEHSGHKNIAAGQTFFAGMVLRFHQQGGLLLAQKVESAPDFDESSATAINIRANSLPSYAYVFEIVSQDEGSICVEVTRFFGDEIAGVCPLPGDFKSGKFEPRLSGIVGCDNRENRISIRSRLVYTGVKEQFTAVVSYGLTLMDAPMGVRREDPRVGYMTVSGSVVRDNQPIRNEKYVTRWRVEPRPEDMERYMRGEKVVPARPIVFYIDPSLPEHIGRYARLGILDWNRAFEEIGFRDAIQVLDIPSDGTFNSMDPLVNMVRYVPTATANAMGATTVDPRSGEIVQGDIYWFHNVVELLNKWRFVQTAASDPAARRAVLPDELLGEMIRYVAAHEMGHVLGLKHNMRGSYAYPVDSLRSPAFTAKYGTTASIMDYARFNYVAQPGDLERGVRLMPPHLGVYDYMAIAWGYGCPQGGDAALDAILRKGGSDPMCAYANSYMGPIVPDPSSQSDVLGDDVVRSSEYGIRNLRYMTGNLIGWCEGADNSLDLLATRYELIYGQFFKYLTNCASYAGGVYYQPAGPANLSTRYEAVGQREAAEAIEFIFTQLNAYPEWLADAPIFGVIGNNAGQLIKEQNTLLSSVIKTLPERIALSGGDVNGFFESVSAIVFAPGTGRNIYSQNLQAEYIAQLRELASSRGGLAPTAAHYALSQLENRIKKMGNSQTKKHFEALTLKKQ